MSSKVSHISFCMGYSLPSMFRLRSLLWLGAVTTNLVIISTTRLAQANPVIADTVPSTPVEQITSEQAIPEHLDLEQDTQLMSPQPQNVNKTSAEASLETHVEITTTSPELLINNVENLHQSPIANRVNQFVVEETSPTENSNPVSDHLDQISNLNNSNQPVSSTQVYEQATMTLLHHQGEQSQTDLHQTDFTASELAEATTTPLPLDRSLSGTVTSESVASIANADTAELPSAPSLQAADLSQPPASQRASDLLRTPLIHLQGGYLLQGSDSSARLRVTGLYIFSPQLLIGGSVDLTTGNAFSDSQQQGLNLNELYVTVAPLPNLHIVAGLMDLTSYFDRNSFAKDGLTHFFNSVFQTNPALAATGIGSRIGVLTDWNINDNVEIKAATFSSSRNLGELALDAFAGEVGLRFGNAIIRGTYVTDRDAGAEDGFQEIYNISRSGNRFGLLADDRESAYGLNAELFIPEINLGLFSRYGWYQNSDIGRSGQTYSFGLNLLDLFLPSDRLGLAYGQDLSNADLRGSGKRPDVLELFYDIRLTPNVRVAITAQERREFSETVLGFRIRANFDVSELGRLFE
jgi:hypothetical protein